MKCKHKNHEIRNELVGGYNIPDGITTEYDVYCKDCGEFLYHWAYGVPNIDNLDNVVKYEFKGFSRIKAMIDFYSIKRTNKKINNLCRKNNINLPF